MRCHEGIVILEKDPKCCLFLEFIESFCLCSFFYYASTKHCSGKYCWLGLHVSLLCFSIVRIQQLLCSSLCNITKREYSVNVKLWTLPNLLNMWNSMTKIQVCAVTILKCSLFHDYRNVVCISYTNTEDTSSSCTISFGS